jgi:hypothetical protein
VALQKRPPLLALRFLWSAQDEALYGGGVGTVASMNCPPSLADIQPLESEGETLERQSTPGGQVFLWRGRPKDVPDPEELRPVILPGRDTCS